jgi:replicative DNA helicase
MEFPLQNIDYDLDKIPPNAIQIEYSIIGSILNDSNLLNEISDILFPKCFYKDENQKIFNVIIDLYSKEKTIDILTVQEELQKKNELENIGGPYRLTQLLGENSYSNIKEHALIIKDKYLKRELIRISNEINRLSYDDSIDLGDIIDYYNKVTDEFNESVAGISYFKHISRVLNQVMEVFVKREALAKEGKLIGLRTPLKELNKFIGGWRSELIIIAARPGIGKTAWSLALSKTLAFDNIPVCIYSLEMSDYLLAERLIYAEADMNDEDIYKTNHGYMNDTLWVKIKKAKLRLEKLPIYIDDNSCVDINYIKSHSRIMNKKNLCGAIIIDYLQLTSIKREKNKNKAEIISNICRELRTLRKNLNIPIIVLSQLNRDLEKRGGDKKPQLADIKESGGIEESADMIMFIHRPYYYKMTTDSDGNSTEGMGELIIAKNKNGPIDTIKFSHNKSLTKITDYIKKKSNELKSSEEKIKIQSEIQFDLEDDDVPF